MKIDGDIILSKKRVTKLTRMAILQRILSRRTFCSAHLFYFAGDVETHEDVIEGIDSHIARAHFEHKLKNGSQVTCLEPG